MSSRRKNPHGRHDKPNARPGARPSGGGPGARSNARSDGRSNARPGARSSGGPPGRSNPRSDAHSHGRPERRSTVRQEGRAQGRPEARPNARPGARPQGGSGAGAHSNERRESRFGATRPRSDHSPPDRSRPASERNPHAAERNQSAANQLDLPPKAVPRAERLAAEEPTLPLIEQDFEQDFADEGDGELGDFVDFVDSEAHDADFMEEAPELGIGARVVPPNLRYEGEVSSSAPPSAPNPSPPRDVEAQIRSLEARLDGLIRRAALTEESDAEKSEESHAISVAPAPFVATTTDNSTRDYVARRWGREALRDRSEEVDDFGHDPSFERKVLPGLELLYRRYFRVQVEGMEHVPRTGRGVIVANHSGAIPLDGVMLRTAMRLEHPGVRDLRWLAEDFLFYLPFAGVFMNRIGAVRACPENAERLLSRDGLVAVFPEGVQGIRKLFRDRYQLQRFGRGGYIRLCLRMRAPLVPCAIIGGEETNPLVYRFDRLAELLKLPYLPVTPTFPWLGPLGLIPAPARWKIRFGEPLSFDNYGPEAADDDVLVGRLSERVRASIQSLLDTGLRERKSVWFG